MYSVSPFMQRFAISLGAGVSLATLWVNSAPRSYYDMIEWRMSDLGWLRPLFESPPSLTPLNLVAEGLIPLFMFLIGKELWEAIVLERGGFAGRAAIVPVAGTLGAALGAVLVWNVLARAIDPSGQTLLAQGWPLPIGGDVVLVYLFGRLTFTHKSNALRLLLLVMIALDMLGLIMLGLTHPNGGLLRTAWLGLPLLAAWAVWQFHAKPLNAAHLTERARLRANALWPYVLAGLISYFGVIAAGLPGALGLLPIIPAIAHADRSFGLFAAAEEMLQDPLNRMAHALIWPITLILFIFGLTRGGIDLAAFAPPTVLVLAAFWLGKPFGFLLGVAIALRAGAYFGKGAVHLPQDVGARALVRVALLLGIGFTVPVLTLDTALDGGQIAEAARLGLALTLGLGAATLFLPRR
jgi:Na+:H+ antiporter, NhaA family